MDRELAQLVEDKLDGDSQIDVASGLLILAALESDESLESALGGDSSPSGDNNETSTAPVPVGAYLTSIAVEGFRGIGPRAELPIEPGPGLTLVIGPNGCGKSSFAEGLEMLLTGSNRRWDDRSAIWKEGWRNLHEGDLVRVEAGLAIEGTTSETRIERHWDAGDQLPDSVATAQTIGQPRGDLSMLGWDDALVHFRPFLSYNELGTTLEAGPTTLYDSVSRVLGLDALVDARARLRQARLSRQQALGDADTIRTELIEAVEVLDDARAGQCLEALQSDGWGLGVVERALEGATGSDAADELTTLRQLAAIAAPDEAAAQVICERLREARVAHDATRDTDAGRALQVADLLESAVRFHVAGVRPPRRVTTPAAGRVPSAAPGRSTPRGASGRSKKSSRSSTRLPGRRPRATGPTPRCSPGEASCSLHRTRWARPTGCVSRLWSSARRGTRGLPLPMT